MPERSWQSFGGDLIMEKERLPETSPVAAAVSPGGKATASKPGEGEIWQISQLRAKTSKAAWTDNTVMGWGLQQLGWPQERWGAQQEACQTLPLPARDPNPEERVSSSLRHLQQMNDQQQQRAPPPPAVQQQRRPLQPPLAQPPLGGLQQQGVPSNPAGQQPWNQPQWGPQQPVFAPPFNATFDGDPEKLIFFLNQVRSHLNHWAYLYPEPGAMVDVIGANLEGEASEWLNNLYSEQALELEDPHLFLLGLRERFEDPSIGLKAAGQIHKIKQAGRPALEYVREFRKMAGRIEGWPEQSLIHHFIEGLDDHLSQACIYREVPDRLQEWYQTAVKLDVKLSRYKKPPPQEPEQQPELPEQQSPPRKPSTTARAERPRPPARPSFECFRCGQGGHRAATCPVPYPRLQSKPGPAMQKKPAQRLPREKSNRLTQEPVAQVTPHTQENAKTPGGPAPALPFFDSNDEGENDPMDLSFL
ncbi:Retrotransposon-derived protein PEG10 [Crotalus adamanteus]|uniref:Retrotransposon-derived protein PEG10 n=1 Tax=Crotalus adamanteus TaxID=8729 RepID=A0AAW1B247_CROAD